MAARDQAALDLSHTRITAPDDGITAKVDLRPGQYVQSGQPAFALVEMHRLYIEANLKETDLTYVKAGQSASIEVDSLSRPPVARASQQPQPRHRLGVLDPAAAERDRQLGQGRAARAGAPGAGAGRGRPTGCAPA